MLVSGHSVLVFGVISRLVEFLSIPKNIVPRLIDFGSKLNYLAKSFAVGHNVEDVTSKPIFCLAFIFYRNNSNI